MLDRLVRRAVLAEADQMPDRIAQLGAEVRSLEQEQARLELDREIARDRYETLARRAHEIGAALETGRPELRIAARALPPAGPDYGRVLRSALAALALGLVAGSAVVLLWPGPGWRASAGA